MFPQQQELILPQPSKPPFPLPPLTRQVTSTKSTKSAFKEARVKLESNQCLLSLVSNNFLNFFFLRGSTKAAKNE